MESLRRFSTVLRHISYTRHTITIMVGKKWIVRKLRASAIAAKEKKV